MTFVNFSTREILVKIVYYGPGLGGKTTSLQYIYNSLPENNRGKMISLATDEDRTIYFDFLPVYLGKLQGFTVRLQLYTVPGQVRYNQTRRLVLKGVDGIVFVADLQRHRKFSNVESFQNLEENLAHYGLELARVPHVIQYNKIDLSNILDVEELNRVLNKYGAPYFRTCAVTGEGVLDTLTAISKLVFDDLRRRGLRAAAQEAAEEGAETVEVAQASEVDGEPEAVEVAEEDLAAVEPTPATGDMESQAHPELGEIIETEEEEEILASITSLDEESLNTGETAEFPRESTDILAVEETVEPSVGEIPELAELPGIARWWWSAVPSPWIPLWRDLFSAWERQDPDAFRVAFQALCRAIEESTHHAVETLLPDAVRSVWRLARLHATRASVWDDGYAQWAWLLLWGLGWACWMVRVEEAGA